MEQLVKQLVTALLEYIRVHRIHTQTHMCALKVLQFYSSTFHHINKMTQSGH